MADNLNNTNKAASRRARRGIRARLGVGLLAIGLTGGAGAVAMTAQPASAAPYHGPTIVIGVDGSPSLGPVAHALGVSWS